MQIACVFSRNRVGELTPREDGNSRFPAIDTSAIIQSTLHRRIDDITVLQQTHKVNLCPLL
jgi:hypothetical protein